MLNLHTLRFAPTYPTNRTSLTFAASADHVQFGNTSSSEPPKHPYLGHELTALTYGIQAINPNFSLLETLVGAGDKQDKLAGHRNTTVVKDFKLEPRQDTSTPNN